MKGSAEDKRRIMEMLQRQSMQQAKTESGRDFSSDPSEDISKRLEGVCLDDVDTLWERLTDHEKYLFQERVRTGNLDFITVWTPWWERYGSSVCYPG